jgi:acyl dehydratase
VSAERVTTELTLAELEAASDLELEPSDWVTIEQRAIEQFAEATGDRQWIHVDPERAAQGPFGTTVAHGYLSLALLPGLLGSVLTVTDARMGVNYGIERVRFTAPVPSGSRVRLKAVVRSAERRGEGVLYRVGAEVEIEGADKPALVGEVVYLVL